ncbi:SIR2-like protein [Flavobacterium endophyticum]|uniref:SIR2-like protein n=1 Tax=Flavobacterium endophyticum TaxID=1540163 RepID=A0A495MF62_9FLAO|nr:SIR2 family protein [Flavobacterium endophyticum]RKS23363.1 SIR2-like protein [Flavobacterium endophyticum]
MDIDTLLKLLQNWTNKVPLIILGSGASVPFKLPSMWDLGEYIKDNVILTDKKDKLQFEKFKKAFEKNGDLESTLSSLQLRSNVLYEIVCKTWELVNKKDLEAYESLICSKVNFPLFGLTQYLLSSAGSRLSIVTTNYDRLAEYAASFSNSFICTGYTQNLIGNFSKDVHLNKNIPKGYNGQVNIWKVHGSLDWFKNVEDEKNLLLPLRHLVPLGYVPSIVTPGLSKYMETHNEPYRTIFTEADKEIENANGYLCIGYGFNDMHVQPKLISQIKAGKPIIVLTKQLSPKTKQSIIDNKCKNYVLMEEDANDNRNTKIYTSALGNHIVEGVNYWELSKYLELIK